MMRRVALHTRLTLLSAAAVAVAVAACAVAAWFLVRQELRHELDQALLQAAAPGPPGGPGEPGRRRQPPEPDWLCSPPQDGETRLVRPFLLTVQAVHADGSRCTGSGIDGVVVDAADIAVARGERDSVLRDGVADDGTPMRILTRRAGPGTAMSYARSLQEIDESLDTLALLLAAVAALGVLGAGTAGLLVARAGLAPVDRLTAVAEHIARTEDLTVAIPADGNDEVARLGRAFNSMTSSLAHSLERQQRLVADAGHELRTPLTSLRANVELLLRSETTNRALPPGRRRTLLTSSQAQLAELSSLVGDLLQLARPAAAAGTTGSGPVAWHDVVADAVARVRLRGPDIVINAQLSPWYVRHDATGLARAVVNLLDNAVKFSPPESTVDVELRAGELTVVDRGAGIARADLPYVFDRFWRAPSARAMPGSGLGLSIVAQVAREAGGTVEIVPGKGGGTVARLRLPGTATPGASPGTSP